METARELMEKLRGLKYEEQKKEYFQKLKIIVETLERAGPFLRIETREGQFSGKCLKLKLKRQILKFTLKDSFISKKEVKIPEELIAINLWQNKSGEPLFWNDLFKEKEEKNEL